MTVPLPWRRDGKKKSYNNDLHVFNLFLLLLSVSLDVFPRGCLARGLLVQDVAANPSAPLTRKRLRLLPTLGSARAMKRQVK